MGKNKQAKSSESLKHGAKTGQHPSQKKPKRDGKPKQEDHLQQIPFRLREIMKSKERMKMGPKKAKKIKKKVLTPKPKTGASQVGDIPVPHFRRRKKESEKAYLRRMGNEAQHVLFLTKNQVERQPELEQEKQEKPADKRKSEKKKEFDKVRLQRLHKKKLDRRADKEEKDRFTDVIGFGEVAMAPPSLSIKPRKAPVKPQGVSTKGLLLNTLLGHIPVSTNKPSMARQRIMEEERVRVVQAYRLLKKQKQQHQEAKSAGLDKLLNLQ